MKIDTEEVIKVLSSSSRFSIEELKGIQYEYRIVEFTDWLEQQDDIESDRLLLLFMTWLDGYYRGYDDAY